VTDVAVFTVSISVTGPAEAIPPSNALPAPGSEVAALGFPMVPQWHPTLGIFIGNVEALPTDYSQQNQFIQVSFQTAGGNSGGPLLDQYARALGVVSERTFEQVEDKRVPARPFSHVTPISRVFELDKRQGN
jgi:S1-C subfamily serine protease